MKQTPLLTLLLLGTTLLLSSCVSNLYTPNEAYMLGVSNPGDVKIAGSHMGNSSGTRMGFNRLYRQSNIQLAISPIKNVGLVGSHFRQSSADFNDPPNSSRKHSELGLGYYHKSKQEKETDKSFVVQDIYVGTGWGKSYELFPSAGEMQSSYQRYFLHYGLHLWWKNELSIGFGLRYVTSDFDQIELIGNVPDLTDIGVFSIRDRNPIHLLEGSLHIQAGGNYAKLFLSTTGVLRSSYLDFSGNYRIGAPSVNLGIVLDLDEIYKKAILRKNK